MTEGGRTSHAADCPSWPTAASPYIDPVPNAPYMEYTLLHLTPVP